MEKRARVQKFIALSGLCSRRKAEILIEEKRVKVNGNLVKLGDLCSENDDIRLDSKKISFNLKNNVYIVLNKPIGYISTKSDEYARKNIYDLIKKKDLPDKIFSVGRLDKDSSGLLILTNDGEFCEQIIHPSKNIAKEYEIELNRVLDDKHKEKIEEGLILDEIQLSPCKIIRISKKKYTVIIWEGRKRQIRRMFEQKHYKVFKLHRHKIGGLNLNLLNIREGEYKFVTKEFLNNTIFK